MITNKETRIKRTIGIIMLVFVIGILTFGMFIPVIEKNIDTNKQTNTTIQNINDKDLYLIKTNKYTNTKLIDTKYEYGIEYLTVEIKFEVIDLTTNESITTKLPNIEIRLDKRPGYVRPTSNVIINNNETLSFIVDNIARDSLVYSNKVQYSFWDNDNHMYTINKEGTTNLKSIIPLPVPNIPGEKGDRTDKNDTFPRPGEKPIEKPIDKPETQKPDGISKGVLAGYIVGGILIGLTLIGLIIYYIIKDKT